MTALFLLQEARPEVSAWWGIIVPALVLAVAFIVTLMLFRHFSKQ